MENNMITEYYVSFETAKLLKEKGFDEDCHAYWDLTTETKTPKIGLSVSSKNWNYKWNPIPFPISAPTLQMAMKWLREEKGFHIFAPLEIDYDEDERGDKWYHDATYYPEIIRVSDGKIMYDDGSLYAEPEQACEAAIKYCLENLI